MTLTKELYVKTRTMSCHISRIDSIKQNNHSGTFFRFCIRRLALRKISTRYRGVRWRRTMRRLCKNEELSYDWAFREAKRINDKKSIEIIRNRFSIRRKILKKNIKKSYETTRYSTQTRRRYLCKQKTLLARTSLARDSDMLKEYSISELIKYIKRVVVLS